MNNKEKFKQDILTALLPPILEYIDHAAEALEAKEHPSFFDRLEFNQPPQSKAMAWSDLTNKHDRVQLGDNRMGENPHRVWKESQKQKDWSTATLEDVPVNWMPESDEERTGVWAATLGGRLFPTERLLNMYRDQESTRINKALIANEKDNKEWLDGLNKPKERWKPKAGDWYWYIRETGQPLINQCKDGQLDSLRMAFGNYFKTESEAEKARDEVKELLLSK